jgi:hypothetical protein
MIFADLTGNIGNNLFQYAVTRSVAEHCGYEWGFNRHPSHDYHNGAEQMDFMEIDYGKEHSTPWGALLPDTQQVWTEPKFFVEDVDVVAIHPWNPDVFSIPDNTKLVIECCQDAKYFNKEDIRKWFKIKEDKILEYEQILKDNNIILNEDTCIINVRGGYEYRHLPQVLLDQSYWNHSINHITNLNYGRYTDFVVITDDVEYAQSILPFRAYHFSIGCDYYTINNAHNLIISNSSFGIFPAWLNKKAYVIAPKFWAGYNHSNQTWVNSDVQSFNFMFMDREGKVCPGWL